MPPNQGSDPKDSSMSSRVPTGVKDAAIQLANILNGFDAYVEIDQSTLLRRGLYRELLANWEHIPSAEKENISKEWLQRQIDDGPGAGLQGADADEVDA